MGKANGCGSDKVKICGRVFRPPHHIFFEASCNKHDELYGKGGKEIDRKVADILFLYYMNADVKTLSIWKRPYYYVWTHLYYFAVRMIGGTAFTYRK